MFFAATSTWEHTTSTTDIHAQGGIRTCSPSKQTKSHSLDRAANGVGLDWVLIVLIVVLLQNSAECCDEDVEYQALWGRQ